MTTHPEPRRIRTADYDALNRALDAFAKAWDHFNGPPATPEVWDNPRPQGWRKAVGAYHRHGVSDDDIAAAVRIAFERDDVPQEAKFNFALGVMKARTTEAMREQQERGFPQARNVRV